MSFEQALSGLNAASQNLDAIGNNIANAATTGYKEGRAEFADVFAASLASGGRTQIGIGTSLAAVSPQFTQGNITTTGNPMDVAINGQGFFRMATNGVVSFSRDGAFSLNSNGYNRQQQRRAAHRLSGQRRRHHQPHHPGFDPAVAGEHRAAGHCQCQPVAEPGFALHHARGRFQRDGPEHLQLVDRADRV